MLIMLKTLDITLGHSHKYEEFVVSSNRLLLLFFSFGEKKCVFV